MTDLMKIFGQAQRLRHIFLMTASTAAVIGVVFRAHADPEESKSVWIEMGGQLERVNQGDEPYSPTFFDAISENGLTSPGKILRANRYTTGWEGSLAFSPENTKWKFLASVRYGRSSGHRFDHDQPATLSTRFKFIGGNYVTQTIARYAQTDDHYSKSNLILDFSVGRDVGLGLLGGRGSSTMSFGVRFAQLGSDTNASILARPDGHFESFSVFGGKYHVIQPFFHEYQAAFSRRETFHGWGPSVSWRGTEPLVGHAESGEFDLDWGVNAAVLFGRQRTTVHHKTRSDYHYAISGQTYTAVVPSNPHATSRTRMVTVPNIGASGGVSFRYDAAKISMGYRADFFFGAMDNGLDTRSSGTTAIYGPFATISVGLP